MAYFLTRIELHNADSDDYETLHEAMEEKGFKRTVRSTDGAVYHLPDAEYLAIGDFAVKDVIEVAKHAASATGNTFGIIVSESNNLRFHGLSRVTR